MVRMPELGFYGLAGHSDSPADLLAEVRRAEEIGLGSCFVSERFNVKEAASLTGAACAVTSELGVATGVTNHTTRHPLVTAAWATTLHRLSGGRFALGFGRGFDSLLDAIGAPRATIAGMEDFAGVMRRLWRGETILGHDGPAGRFPFLRLEPTFDEDIPLLLAALGPKTQELAGRAFDGLILHTFFTDEALARCVDRARGAAERAGRDPAAVRVWAVLATLSDPTEERRLHDIVARMATYLQVYGDALIAANGWDHAPLDAFRASPLIQTMPGAIDAVATDEQLADIAELIPEEWVGAAAVGSPETCAARIMDQLAAGADGVILHASTPDQLAPVLEAYGRVRDHGAFAGRSSNPGR